MRVHRVAPPSEGRPANAIAYRPRDQEAKVLAQLEMLNDRFGQWQESDPNRSDDHAVDLGQGWAIQTPADSAVVRSGAGSVRRFE